MTTASPTTSRPAFPSSCSSPGSPATTDTAAQRPLSGAQFSLSAGGYRAEIASVGATLRSLAYDDRDLVVPFEADEMRPAMRGALLAPWPNRTADGRYEFAGAVHQLAINEVATGNAAHGLVAWQDFTAIEHTDDSVHLTSRIQSQPGYPWRVRIDVVFRLSDDGLEQEVRARNESRSPAPFGLGGHPYLLAAEPGRRVIDSWHLELPARTVLEASRDRWLPIGTSSVEDHEAGAFDFRRRRAIGAAQLNHAFTDLERGHDGRARVRVTGDNGRGTEICWDERCPWVQVYTADASTDDDFRHAVAVEPMSCPPDALNSKQDLVALEPDDTAAFGWIIRALP